MKNQPIQHRLGFAFKGISAAWRNEMSFRQQCVAAFFVVLVLVWLRPAPVWWALLLLNCGMVLAAEPAPGARSGDSGSKGLCRRRRSTTQRDCRMHVYRIPDRLFSPLAPAGVPDRGNAAYG
jgi:hypothetical protein